MQLRARELAQLDPSNRALQQQVWALQDQQAAAQAASAATQALAQKMQQVAQERYNLETQLLQAQGNTAELRARELAQLDPSNRALQQQVWALQDQQAAAQAAASAASAASSAWKSLTDSVVNEVRRIRGEIAGTGSQGIAAAQMSFSVATAQARAGSQSAWDALPQASKALLDAAQANTSSLLELQRIQAATAASLETTLAARGVRVPAFASGGTHSGGYAVVGEQGPELVYMPPAHVYNAGQTREILGDGSRVNEQMLEQLLQLNERMQRIEQLSQMTRTSSELTARVLDDAARGKQPLTTETA